MDTDRPPAGGAGRAARRASGDRPMIDEPARATGQVWAALLVVYVVWGSTYLGIAVLVETLPPLLGMGTRFGASAVLLALGLLVVRGPRALAVPPRQIAGAATVGLLLLLGGNGLVALSERYVASGVVALLIAVTPVWVVVLRLIGGDQPRSATVAGVVVGLGGVAALVVTTGRSESPVGAGYQDIDSAATFAWAGVVVLAALLWAIGSFLAPRLAAAGRMPADALVMTFWELAFGALGLCLAGLLHGEQLPDPAAWGTRGLIAWSYLVVAGLGAFLAYTWLLGHARLSLVATYAFVNPVVAVVLGWWLKDESLTAAVVACAAVIVAGVVLVVRGETDRG